MNGSITALAQTTNLKPGQSYTVQIGFNNLEPCKLRYELTSYDSGTITPEGVYTAPQREGSFEIRILCEQYPDINTFAYVEVER